MQKQKQNIFKFKASSPLQHKQHFKNMIKLQTQNITYTIYNSALLWSNTLNQSKKLLGSSGKKITVLVVLTPNSDYPLSKSPSC